MLNQSIRNTNTLFSIAKEIRVLYTGWKFDKVLIFDKGIYDLYLTLEGNEIAIRFDLTHKYSSVYILSHKPKYKSSIELFDKAEGYRLLNTKVLRHDRIIKLDFGKFNMIAELFGRGGSRLLLLNQEHKIIYSLGKETGDTEYILPAEPASASKSASDTSTIENSASATAFSPGDYPYRWPSHYLREYESIKAKDISYSIDDFHRVIQDSDEFFAYSDSVGNQYFSHLRLSESQQEEALLFASESPSQIVERIVSKARYQEYYGSIYNTLNAEVRKRKSKLENKIAAFSDSDRLLSKSQNYRLYGDILMSQPDVKSKSNLLETNDWEGQPIAIPLDDKINRIDNAQKYYEKSKKLEKTVEEHLEMLPKLEAELLETLETEDLLESKPKIKELEKLQKNNRWLQGQSFKSKKKEDKFRRFPLSDQVVLYVGKSAANNDELTNHFAKPNDLWLHAKDVSGSHGVIKGTNNGEIRKDLLEKAAAIIAYYSSAKNQTYVPVSYTQKKYVRKPKGAAVGAVIVTKEDVVFVEPGKD